jgi:hypothetical protein
MTQRCALRAETVNLPGGRANPVADRQCNSQFREHQMKREYHTLAAHRLQAGARYHQPGQNLEHVRIDSPALAVMTDLRQIPAATIDLEAPLDAANRFMIRRGVRLLLVTDDNR